MDLLMEVLRLRDRWQFSELAMLCDPLSVTEFFRMHCELLRPNTLEELRVMYPDVPEDTAPTAFARLLKSLPNERDIGKAVAGIPNYAVLLALAPTEFLARWLEADDPRYEIVRLLQARGESIPEWFLRFPGSDSYEIRLVHSEDPHTVRIEYAIVGLHEGERYDISVQSESVRRQPNGEWRMLVRPRFLQARESLFMEVPAELRHLLPPPSDRVT
jgi:hypothetical protein